MGADTLKVGKAFGATTPNGTSQSDANAALNNVIGIPGGLFQSGNPSGELLPAYPNIGTTAGKTINEVFAAIVPGASGASLHADEWEFELAADVPAGDPVLQSSFVGINGTTGSAPIDTWLTDNTITLSAGGDVVSRVGTANVDLEAVYFGSPPQLQFNRGLYLGNRVTVRKSSVATILAPAPIITPIQLGPGDTEMVINQAYTQILGDVGANTIATITGSTHQDGVEIILHFLDSLVTLTDTDSVVQDAINLEGAASDLVSAKNTIVKLVSAGGSWYQTSPACANT